MLIIVSTGGGALSAGAGGVVTLSGTVRATEFDRLVSAVLKVRGVQDVNDALQIRATEA